MTQQHFNWEGRKSMMKILCHQHYAFTSPPASPPPSSAKTLLKFYWIFYRWSLSDYSKTFEWNMDGARECLIYWITNRQMYTQTHIVLDSVGLFNHLKHKLLAMCDETRRPIQSRPIICLSSDIDSNFNWISLVSLQSIASYSHNINRHTQIAFHAI